MKTPFDPVPQRRDPEEWRASAAYRDHDPDMFYPDPADKVGQLEALIVCDGCPVIRECRAFADRTGDRFAVLGGTTPGERGNRRWRAA